jgi:hypothetical protein
MFLRSQPQVRVLFERFLVLARACGPVTVIPQKTRVALRACIRFAAVTPQRKSLRGHLLLPEPHESPCFTRIERLSPRAYVHNFRLESEDKMGQDFQHWVAEAYRAAKRKRRRAGAENAAAPQPMR